MYLSLLLLLTSMPAAPYKADAARLLNELKSNDAVRQDKAARELAALGAPAVPALIEALKSDTEGVVGRAALALGKIGKPAQDAVPALIARIKENKGRSRDDAEAIEALMRIAPHRGEVVPALCAILREPPSNPCRIHAVVALGKMGTNAKDAVPDLIKMLDEEPGKAGPIRFHAATALGQIGSEAKKAVPALVKLLNDENAGPGRRTVVVALGQMGPAAKDAVAALKKARAEAALREAADKALARIEGDR
ncbi:MAG TPA: HEAT repeat domain-containing protein [Gemmataceae bacterium]|nr:HEAT repeat domain-containing protein [Gemmataceae bacterium]